MYKKYRIKAYYRAGNSEGPYVESLVLEMGWNNLNIAKINLARIRQHWEWYCSKYKLPKPEFVHTKYNFCLNIMSDDANEMSYSADKWCDYYYCGRLYGAEIIEDRDPTLYFKTKHANNYNWG